MRKKELILNIILLVTAFNIIERNKMGSSRFVRALIALIYGVFLFQAVFLIMGSFFYRLIKRLIHTKDALFNPFTVTHQDVFKSRGKKFNQLRISNEIKRI